MQDNQFMPKPNLFLELMDTVNASDKVDYTAMDHMIELLIMIMTVVPFLSFLETTKHAIKLIYKHYRYFMLKAD